MLKHEINTQVRGIANKQIYESDDRVKAFKSKILCTDVVHERDYQVAFKGNFQEIDQMRNEIDLENQRVKEIEFQRAENEQNKILKEKKDKLKEVVRIQKHEKEQKFIDKIYQNKIEGEVSKIKAQQAVDEEQELKRQKKEQQILLMAEIKRDNEELKVLKQKEIEKIKEEEKKIEEFAVKKDRILQMKKQREEQKQSEKMEQRQKLIDKQIGNLQIIKENAENLIDKNIKEAQLKEEKVAEAKAQYKKMLTERIDQQLQFNLKKKAAEKKQERINDEHFQQQWKEKNIQINAQEKQEKIDALKRNQSVQNDYKQQIAEKNKRKEEEISAEFEEAYKNNKIREEQDYHFEQWANQIIEEQKEQGKQIRPLLIEKEQYKKRIQ